MNATSRLLLHFFVMLALVFRLDAQERPNVVLIVVDDLGWYDLASYGSTYYQTPNVDQLAQEGLKYTNAYSACTVCSPTRAAILSGKSPARLHCTDWIEGWKMKDEPLTIPDWTMYLDTAEYTLAEAFLENGYSTGHVGKWHLGEDSIYWPENQGFQVNLGGWSSGSPTTKKGLYNGFFAPFGNPRLPDLPDDEYLTERLSREAVRFISENHPQETGRPFFLNYWMYSVHTPIQAKAEMVKKFELLKDTTNAQQNPTYAAMVAHMDEAVGQVVKALKDQGLYDNTILIFTSDNGGLIGRRDKVTQNGPLRSGKGDMYEGGIRIPLIIRAPDFEAGITDSPSISMDLFPTIASISGLKVPEQVKANFEGRDLTKANQPRDLFWHYPHYHIEGAKPYSAIRSGDWKLIYYYETGSSELFNLQTDLSETTDLSERQPAKKRELLAKLEAWKREVGAQLPTPR